MLRTETGRLHRLENHVFGINTYWKTLYWFYIHAGLTGIVLDGLLTNLNNAIPNLNNDKENKEIILSFHFSPTFSHEEV